MTTTFTPRSIGEREERIAEIRAEIQNIGAEFEGRKFDEEARDRWNRLNEEMETHQDAIEELRTRKNRLAELAGNQHAVEGARTDVEMGPANYTEGPTSPMRGLSPSFSSSNTASQIPSLFPDPEELRRLHAAVRVGSSVRLESRATVTTAGTGADELGVPVATRTRRERRLAVAARLGVQLVNGITEVHFPVFGEGDAGIPETEAATKPEFDAITPDSATPQVIALWTRTTRQNLATMLDFQAKLRSVLSAKVARREDQLLVDTVLANSDIQQLVQALDADAVLEAAALVSDSDVAAEPNLVAINPADAPTLLGVDVGAGGTASPPFTAFLPTIHGMSVYVTSHVDAGEAIVGAWDVASHFVLGISPTFLVDALSRVTSNEVTLLLEEAVALAIDEPQGFVHITATT